MFLKKREWRCIGGMDDNRADISIDSMPSQSSLEQLHSPTAVSHCTKPSVNRQAGEANP